MQLYIGNQNYSTWSLRAWLIFDHYNLAADVIKLKLFTPDFYNTLAKVTPTAKVPTLWLMVTLQCGIHWRFSNTLTIPT